MTGRPGPVPAAQLAPTALPDEVARRGWAAMMLTRDLATCRSILRGLRVRAGNLDGLVLRRGLRGGSLPDAEAFIEVTAEMLDAVAEAGPLTAKGACR
jgi:hypothetical protein